MEREDCDDTGSGGQIQCGWLSGIIRVCLSIKISIKLWISHIVLLGDKGAMGHDWLYHST